jgi:hypothetical protein
MTTLALVAGMMPVAIGVGEGGEFYSPMAVAIIGGVLVSTLLTLLVVPSLYDNVEISRERFKLKLAARTELSNPVFGFLLTFFEAVATLLTLRFFYRVIKWLINIAPPEHPVIRAGREAGFQVPAGFVPYPAPWQRRRSWENRSLTPNPYAVPAAPIAEARPIAGD